MASNSADIVVIGSSNVDFIMGLERLPAVGETVSDGQFSQTFGGKGANQAVAAARAGGRVAFITCLGEDIYLSTILNNLRLDGIDTERIVVQSGIASGSALIMFDRDGNNYLAVCPGANYALLPHHIEASTDLIKSAKLVIMQMEVSTPTTLRALEIAASVGVPVLFNYAPVRLQEIPISEQTGLLIVNETEASALTGLPVDLPEQAEEAAEALRRRGAETVIVTLGAKGACVVNSELRRHIQAFRVDPVDTTAAGDVFCGALAAAIVENRPLLEAVEFASAASALSVTRAGAQPSIPTRNEIDAFLAVATRY